MTDLEQEAAWRTEFEADGERAVLDTICHGPGIYPDPKRSFALRWLREREVERARAKNRRCAPTSAAHFGQRLPQCQVTNIATIPVATPPALVGPVPFTDLQAMIGKAETALEAFVPEEINDCAGKHLDLQIGPRRLAFTSETFILSFPLPNFHFHAVTAYNILRSRGVPLGKRDYEGRLRTSSF